MASIPALSIIYKLMGQPFHCISVDTLKMVTNSYIVTVCPIVSEKVVVMSSVTQLFVLEL